MAETMVERPFADVWWETERARARFEDALVDAAGPGFDYDHIGGDDYDNSLEIFEVPEHVRLNEAALNVIWKAGFSKVYVNHVGGWETHYSVGSTRGWRRRYVSDPNATTTNVIAGDPDPGYYEISYWPEGWANKSWLETGYMRIVPDPLDAALNT